MLVRQVVIPTSPEDLWDALTEPDLVAAWFGSRVEWDLRPGGGARFWEPDGTVRRGVVDAVRRGRHLSFRWWPEDTGPDATSKVSYDLEPDDDGTRLTVTEQPLPTAPTGPSVSTGPSASAHVGGCSSGGGSGMGASRGSTWTSWDCRLLGLWAAPALVAAPAARLVPVLAGRAAR
jgi:uncharacterized protein YndB with AHSA1/START domain